MGRRPSPIGEAENEAIGSLPEPVTACPICGDLDLRLQGASEVPSTGGGELGHHLMCARCRYHGAPVTFDRREDYRLFLRELARIDPAKR